MAVYRLTIEYDGSGWHGWQSQQGVPTIQEAVEDALATLLRTTVPVVGSGRTDAGVHAAGQVAHFETDVEVDPDRLRGSLNGLLPRSIAVKELGRAPDGFHARFGAVLRTYRYRTSVLPFALDRSTRVLLRPRPDFERMNRAAGMLVGRHEFSSFCRAATESTDRHCRVSRADWEKGAMPGHWDFVVSADRFLHGMVRTMVGTLLEIGSGKRVEEDIPRLLQVGDRREAGPAAPARGLILFQVDYE